MDISLGKETIMKQKLVDIEERRTPEEIGTFLMEIGRKLKEDGRFDLVHGEKSYDIAPTGEVELEVQYKTKGEKHKFELEIQWKPGSQGGVKIE